MLSNLIQFINVSLFKISGSCVEKLPYHRRGMSKWLPMLVILSINIYFNVIYIHTKINCWIGYVKDLPAMHYSLETHSTNDITGLSMLGCSSEKLHCRKAFSIPYHIFTQCSVCKTVLLPSKVYVKHILKFACVPYIIIHVCLLLS